MINRNKQQSFTLIELLVVIVIIGILAGVIMISTSSSIDKANFAKAQTFSNTVQEELLLNLVSEWTFDEGTDQTINRVATNNDIKDTWGSNNGTVYGNPQIKGDNDCVSGRCMSFDGDGDYIDYGNGIIGESSYTKSVWIKTNTPSASNIISGSGSQHVLYLSSGNIVASNTWSTPQISRSANFYNDKWHHIVFTYSDSRARIYFNGIFLSPEATLSNGPANSITYVGAYNASNFFKGLMDDIRIYNSALSSAKIKQNYVAGLNSMLSNGNISNEEYNERINELAEK